MGPGQAPGWATAPPPGWAPPPVYPRPGVIPLRPLGITELLDGAITSIRAHPKVMIGLSAVVVTISQVVQVLVTWLLLRDIPEGSLSESATDEQIFDFLAGTFSAAAIALVVTLAAQLILTGILTVVVSRAVLGQSISLGDAWARARPVLWRLLGVTILTFLIAASFVIAGAVPGGLLALGGAPGGIVALFLVLGLLAGVVGAVYVWVSFALAGPSVVLEKQRVVAALRRSRRLVARNWWRVLGVLLLTTVITQIVSSLLQIPFSLLATGGALFSGDPGDTFGLLPLTITSIGTILGGTITFPFAAAVTVLLYVDQRMRREGLDLELARAAGVTLPMPPGGPPPPPPGQGW